MFIQTDCTGTISGLKENISVVSACKDVRTLLILACDANRFLPAEVDPILTQITIPLIGGIFPAIIHNNIKMDRGSMVVGLTETLEVQTIPGLSDRTADFEKLLDQKIPAIGSAKTMLVIVDGFATRIGDFTDSLFNIFGLELNYQVP